MSMRWALHVVSRTPIEPKSHVQLRPMALTRSKDSCCVPCQEILIDMQLSSTWNRERLDKSAYGCAAGLDLSIVLLVLWPTRTPHDEITPHTPHIQPHSRPLSRDNVRMELTHDHVELG